MRLVAAGKEQTEPTSDWCQQSAGSSTCLSVGLKGLSLNHNPLYTDRHNPHEQSKGLQLTVLVHFLFPRVSLESRKMSC